MSTEVERLGQTLENNDESRTEQQSMRKGFVFVRDDGAEEESIIVLGNSSLDANFHELATPDLQDGHTSTTETTRELHEKLAKLTQENGHLKETLQLNKMAMNEHLTILLTRQDELGKVYEAHKQKFAATKSLVNDLRTENNELKARLEANGKTTEASTQTGESDDSIAAENYHSTEMLVMAEKFQHQNQEIAHAQKIIASLKDQLQSLYETTFKPISLEDLQSNMQFQEDPHGQLFRNSFAHYNEKLRQLGHCYEAQTSRYTSIQNCLQQCSELLLQKHNPVVREISPDESQIDQDLRDRRNMLIDEEFKSIAEREEMIKAQSDFQAIFIEFSSMLHEVDSLRKENERLVIALQSARSINDERAKSAEAAAMEKERLLEEQRKGIEQDRQSLLEQNREFQRLSEIHANSLKEQLSFVGQQKRDIEQERQILLEQRIELERLEEVNARREIVLAEERLNLEQEKVELSAQVEEFQRQKEIEGMPMRLNNETVPASQVSSGHDDTSENGDVSQNDDTSENGDGSENEDTSESGDGSGNEDTSEYSSENEDQSSEHDVYHPESGSGSDIVIGSDNQSSDSDNDTDSYSDNESDCDIESVSDNETASDHGSDSFLEVDSDNISDSD